MSGEDCKLISKIYKILLENYTADKAVKEQMIKWAINISAEIQMDQWEFLWKRAIKISMSSTLQENFFKMIYHWYMTPKKIAKINKT